MSKLEEKGLNKEVRPECTLPARIGAPTAAGAAGGIVGLLGGPATIPVGAGLGAAAANLVQQSHCDGDVNWVEVLAVGATAAGFGALIPAAAGAASATTAAVVGAAAPVAHEAPKLLAKYSSGTIGSAKIADQTSRALPQRSAFTRASASPI